MARIRSIHPNACDSRKLALISSDAERLYWRLQTHCDDAGRCEDDPQLIWARCAPLVPDWDAIKVDELLWQLSDHGLIVRYESATGTRVGQYLWITAWSDYQHPQRPTPSKLPDPESSRARFAPVHLAEVYANGRGHVSPGGEWSGVDRSGVEPPLPPAADATNEEM